MPSIEDLEKQLDSFDPGERSKALRTVVRQIKNSCSKTVTSLTDVNLHCHTFFSYNAYGYSPSKFAWLAHKKGLAAAGIIDFDVLDGLEEFYEAGKLLNLKSCVGLETRVFVPEFADKEISSPGEPGITYHIGIGFTDTKFEPQSKKFLEQLRQTAQQRNKNLMKRVNQYLSPVELDYEKEVLTLTPAGNATERHLCIAYARKANAIFPDKYKLAQFWAEKLSAKTEAMMPVLPEATELLNLIRAKTMKRGGIGYVLPDKGSFPQMTQTNQFILQAGAIPTLAWLDGTSSGEKEIENLLELAISSGVSAINIVPDRNYAPGVKDIKLANLYQVIKLAEELNLPVIVGTEMNSPGQKFTDNFASKELSPLVAVFLKGAYIVYAHCALQRQCGLGYTSQWAENSFRTAAAKNDFFAELGRILQPAAENNLSCFQKETSPGEILETIKKACT